MKKLKFAIIGCGRISYKHIEALAANKEEAVLTAVCDIVSEKAEKRKDEYVDKTGKDHEPAVYTDYKEMLAKQEIDVVTIATESGYHPEIAIYCMNNKKNVICEKPMALSIQDADAMIAASEKNHVKLCICHQNRFNKPVQQLRSAVEQHRFGRIINGTARILWNRNMDYYNQAPWRGTWKLDGGTLMNQCIHNIDLLQWMMGGEIDSVYSQCDTFIRNIEAEDFGAIVIRFKNGSIGIVEGSACVYPKNLEETLSVFGEKGTVCIGGLAVNKIETWEFADHRNMDDEILKVQEGDPDTVYGFGHIPLFKNMIDAVNNNTKPLIDGKEGKKGMSIILAAYKSRLTGMPVKFPMGDFSTLDMLGIEKINN
ncbi:Gfo/Idh/MocA family protein [Clostridium luticellarii]|jgi:predicted dehydrogenase|uniref:Inositol 2-dehydrogenase n=1 Tax=Clostridium luticellarii TaxID=1691940 RepID=A0A2T0BQY6_9CLOT|nr:Gfo/Idh/MocA family oxidoreductase [Clostridium luticellarii]MCI1944324.1 Gfo/Idh/MocA family oxidoreductase [Clostridium luticellarii]MCI1967820.1 Gfo/Idh/MocA family oxidoreductase [Clostridium luticellarii]MCI1994698.1 Gfo/Idh/MocA family oxidoreductase [Clostridium luticellarii]MCI2038805.1 Gfo/Idh/MocA family oxidoreductase [Clostridium luticellarii]PRR86288.1 Inositol 2-dehydrogenase [Clostridium luticellarii]